MNTSEILNEIKKLPVKDRLLIVESIIIEDLQEIDPDIENAWIEEASQRLQRAKDGETKTVPGDDVFKKAQKIIEEPNQSKS